METTEPLVHGSSHGWARIAAAWLGALIALMPVVPLTLSHSLTTADKAFWIGITYVMMAAYAGGALLLAGGVTRVVVAVVPPHRTRRVLLGLLGALIVAAVTLLVLPPGPDTGPQPAPTAPSGP